VDRLELDREPPTAASQPAQSSAPTNLPDNEDQDLAGWFYEPVWRDLSLEGEREIPDELWVILSDRESVSEAVAKAFRSCGRRAIEVQAGSRFAGIVGQRASMRPKSRKDIDQLLSTLSTLSDKFSVVICVSPSTQRADDDVAIGAESCGMLLAAIASQRRRPREMWFITTGAVPVGAVDGRIDAGASAVHGLVRAAQLELSQVHIRAIDVASDIGSGQFAETITNILGTPELPVSGALRRGIWHEPGLMPMRRLQDHMPFEVSGTNAYLITGGTSGIGLDVAQELVDRGARKLIIASRHAVQRWQSPAVQRLVASMQSTGALLLPTSVDVAEEQACQMVVSILRDRQWRLDGIVHCAGVLRDALLANQSEQGWQEIWAPKVAGTDHLLRLAEEVACPWMVLMSSLTSLAGQPGQTAYAAANAYLDTICHARRQGVRLMTINWGPWSDLGMASVATMGDESRSELEWISPALGRQLFRWALNHPQAQWAVFKRRSESAAEKPGFLPYATLHPKSQAARKLLTVQPAVQADVAVDHVQSILQEVLAGVLRASVDDFDSRTTFRDHGVDSLMADEIVRQLRSRLGVEHLTVARLFEFPTVTDLSAYLLAEYRESIERHLLSCVMVRTSRLVDAQEQSGVQVGSRRVSDEVKDRSVAVVGYACRFPGQLDPKRFWTCLAAGQSLVAPMPADRWHMALDYDPTLSQWFADRRPLGGFLSNVDAFDASCFRLSGSESRQMDPRQRLFLEVAYAAAEHAGYGGDRLAKSRTGVFVGCGAQDYYSGVASQALEEHSAAGGTSATLPSRLAYFLDLHGPCLTVDTACSSSLVALHLAVESLRSKQSEMAFVGGVHLNLRLANYQALQRAGAISPSHQCRPFDADADGFVPGEGVVVLLLRPLEAAMDAGDTIYGVIRGTAVNNDGRTNGLTAPNPAAQRDVLIAAWADAGINPTSLGYIEAHGTGTRLGDPIELQALDQAFRQFTDRRQFCHLGSTKGAIGHCDAAAGLAGVLKVMLSFEAGSLAKQANLNLPATRHEWETSALRLLDRSQPWPKCPGTSRIAGVSAFGFSGTNAHVVLEEPPTAVRCPSNSSIPRIVPFSAQTEQGLSDVIEQYLREDHWLGFELEDIANTASLGRLHHPKRVAIVARTPQELYVKLHQARTSALSQHAANAQPLDEQVRELAKRVSPAAISRVLSLCRGEMVDTLLAEGVVGSHAVDTGSESEHDAELELIAALYELGARVDWTAVVSRTARQVPLPTYPYQRARYWLSPESFSRPGSSASTRSVHVPSKSESPTEGGSFVYEVHWETAERSNVASDAQGDWLIVTEDSSTGVCLHERFVQRDRQVLVVAASDFDVLADGRAKDVGVEKFRGLLHQLNSSQSLPSHLLYVRTALHSAPDADQACAAIRKLLTILHVWDQVSGTRAGHVRVVTWGGHAVRSAAECTDPTAGAIAGALRSIAIERPRWDVAAVDFASSVEFHDVVDECVTECLTPADDVVIVYRSKTRFRQTVRPLTSAVTSAAPIQIVAAGVYVITGGWGGIGQVLARWLLERFQATVVLLSRVAPRLDSARDEWNGASSDARDLCELAKQCGGRVLSLACDVGQANAMEAAFDEIKSVVGQIVGVFHLAGAAERSRLEDRLSKSPDSVMAKVRGAIHLHEQLLDDPNTWVVAFSSVAGLQGNVFQPEYSAASIFLDSWAAWRTGQGLSTMSLDWGLWAEVGMGAKLHAEFGRQGQPALSCEQALKGLEAALDHDGYQLAIAASLPRIGRLTGTLNAKTLRKAGGSSPFQQRQLEDQLCQILSDVLEVSLERVDPEASFFELGLDSMLAIRVVREIERCLPAVSLTVTAPFDYPTVRQLAEFLAGLNIPTSPESFDLGGLRQQKQPSSTGEIGEARSPQDRSVVSGVLQLRTGRRVARVVRRPR